MPIHGIILYYILLMRSSCIGLVTGLSSAVLALGLHIACILHTDGFGHEVENKMDLTKFFKDELMID